MTISGTIPNDTYGLITRAELTDLRVHAKKCGTCGALATVDPEFHTNRYAHSATFTDDRGIWTWNSERRDWDIDGPANDSEKARIAAGIIEPHPHVR